MGADRLERMGWSLSQEKLYTRKSVSDHNSDCARVSAIADTSALMLGELSVPLPVLPGQRRDMVFGTLE